MDHLHEGSQLLLAGLHAGEELAARALPQRALVALHRPRQLVEQALVRRAKFLVVGNETRFAHSQLKTLTVKVLHTIHRWLALHLNFSGNFAVQVLDLLVVGVGVVGLGGLRNPRGLLAEGHSIRILINRQVMVAWSLGSLRLGWQVLTKLVYLVECHVFLF